MNTKRQTTDLIHYRNLHTFVSNRGPSRLKKRSIILYIHKLVRFLGLNEFISETPTFLRDTSVQNEYKLVYM
jgi:hypothetical protein